MDILGPNFPHLLPQWPTVQQMKDAESSQIRGQRGVANDETASPDGVLKCDEAFLESLIDHLRYMDLLVLRAGDVLNVATTYKTYGGNPLNYNRNVHVREALTVVSKVTPEVERLSKHPELFDSEKRRADFIQEAGVTARLSREMLEIDAAIAKLQPSVQNELNSSFSRRPIDEQTGAHVQPWQSFAHPLSVDGLKKNANWERIQQDVPDMHLERANILPMSASLIAERYRQRAQYLVDNSAAPSAEERAFVQPTAIMLRDVSRSDNHVASVKHPVPVSAQEVERSKDRFAWGKQERVAEMARIMALLSNNVTTLPGQVRPPAVFMGTFRSEEGMRALEEKAAAEKKELEDED